MSEKLQAVRGMNDILPEQSGYWQYLEEILRQLAASYGYQEIRTPILEKTALFQRSIGEVTDIVEKEMYTFLDRDNESLTLRPEVTAGCARAGIQHGFLHNQIQRLWYIGPIFRHERPQKERYRQFYQFGVEALGMSGAAIDAEIILMNERLWERLGLSNDLECQINSLGSPKVRVQYREVLVEYFKKIYDALDEDSQRRLNTNPLRILDSKNPEMQSIISKAPALVDFLDEPSKQHFDRVCELLDKAGLTYHLNPRLVRGLDYYTDTVFEWVTTKLGAQGTVSAGGRYDGLVEQLGGRSTPAAGFSMGLERVIALMHEEKVSIPLNSSPDVYVIVVGPEAESEGLVTAEQLRAKIPTLSVMMDCTGGGFKNQFKRADRSGAKIALILGEDEIRENKISIKLLREAKEQETLLKDQIIDYLKQYSLG